MNVHMDVDDETRATALFAFSFASLFAGLYRYTTGDSIMGVAGIIGFLALWVVATEFYVSA